MKSTLAAYLVSQIAFTASIRRALSSLAGSSLILCALPALGAEAVFSQDGTKVFTTRGMVIDLSAGTISKFVIPGLGQGRIRDLERAGSGEILAVTDSGLIWWDGADGIKQVTGPRLKENAATDADKRKAAYWKPRVFAMPGSRSPFVRIAHGGESHIFWIGFSDDWDEAPDRAAGVYSKVVDEGWEAAIRSNYRVDISWAGLSLAWDVRESEIVCYSNDYRAGSSSLKRWDPSRGRMLGVNKSGFRRLQGLEFDIDGSCYLGGDGDLWHGYIHRDGDDAWLASYRFAPLADLAGTAGNSSHIGVASIALAGPWVYMHLSRMGGSGWGEVVRVAKAEPLTELESRGLSYPVQWDLTKTIARYGQAAESFKSFGTTAGWANLAASPDGKLVYFQAEKEKGKDTRHWLVRNHVEREELVLKKVE